MIKEDENYLNLSGLSQFFDKLKALFATKNEIKSIKGDKGDPGAQGVSVTKVEQTTTSTADAGDNVITVTLSNGTSSTFKVKNGSKGSTGATGAKGTTGSTGTRGSMIYWGTAITGTNATATIFSSSGVSSALVNDLYLNTSTWNIYQCTTAGAASVAKWTYKGNIKGATGAKGAAGTNATTTAIATTSANGLMSKEMVQKLGAIDGITSDINSESPTIAASSKMVHDLNSSLQDILIVREVAKDITAQYLSNVRIPLPDIEGYKAIGIVGESINYLLISHGAIISGNNISVVVEAKNGQQTTASCIFTVLYNRI